LRLDTGAHAGNDPWPRVLIILLTIIAGLYLGQMVWSLFGHVADLVLTFVFAWLISFVLEPVVAGLCRIRWLPRAAAVVTVYLSLLLVIAAGVMLLIPALAAQSALAAAELPAYADRLVAWGGGLTALMATSGLTMPNLTDQLTRTFETVGSFLVANGLTLAVGVGSALAQVLVSVVLSLYLMLDGERISAYLRQTLPARYSDHFVYFVSSVYAAFGGFLRGQIIQGVVFGAGVALIMQVMGLPFVALVSVAAGIAIFIPFFGAVLGVLPPVLAAFSAGPTQAIIVLILTFALSFVVINIVAPKVMSDQIGLHPIVVLAAVLVGARIAGPWGAVFGVPVAAVIVAMLSFLQLTQSERRERLLEMTGTTPDAADVTLAQENGTPADLTPAKN
jgi:predicted PurR-regulated permease PerM